MTRRRTDVPNDYVPVLARDRCPACGLDVSVWSEARRWTHYLDHVYEDPIPDRFMRDRRYRVDPRRRRATEEDR